VSAHCIFCEIVAQRAQSSVVYSDDRVLAFLTIKATRPGECLVIPKAHVDHFQDLDDNIASHIIRVGQMLARSIQRVFNPLRVGYVVSGFGVAHAHLVIVPLHAHDDITSGRYLRLENGSASFSDAMVAELPRELLDRNALCIRESLVPGDIKERPNG
jgi:histidine triad (HIT) family protein